MVTKPANSVKHFYKDHFILLYIHSYIHSYVSYMSCAGSSAAMLGGLYPASMARSAGPSVDAGLTAIQYLLLSHRPVSITTDGIVPIVAIPVAVVAVVAIVSIAVIAVNYSVIYQGSILVLTELADQFGFQR